MESKIILLLILVLSTLILPGIVSAQINCQASTSCSDVELMGMSDESNAHAALAGQGSGYSKLCCSGVMGLQEGSGDLTQDILRLSAQYNAHVENPSLNNYNNLVTLSIDNNPQVIGFECNYRSGGCITGDDCIITLSAETNAHVAGCGSANPYIPAICCKVTIDTENSTISDDYTHDGAWVNGEHDITLDPQDEQGGSGIKEVRYCWGASCNPSQGTALSSPYIIHISGTRDDTLRYQAWDNAGNPSDTGSISVKLDNTPPVTVCGNCPTGQIGNGRDIDLNPTDSHSDIAYTKYCVYEKPGYCDPTGIDGQTYDEIQKIPVGYNCPVSQTCEYVVRYYSVDNTGNQESINSNDIVVNRTLPWCSFESLPIYTTNNQITLHWDGSDPGGDPLDKFRIEFRRRDHPQDTWSQWSLVGDFSPSTKSTTFDASQYGNGEYEFMCVLYTVPGEQSEPDITSTTLDAQTPSISFNLPEWSSQETFEITWSASDSCSGVNHTIIYVNSSPWRQVPGTTTSQQYTGQDGESYAIKLTVYDKAGNSMESGELTITVDTQPPGCSITPLGGFTNTSTFDLSWSSPDQDAESFDICLREDVSDCTNILPDWKGLTTTSKKFTGTQGSTYYFRCRATDRAGNPGEWSDAETTTIDTEAPDLTSDKPDYPDELVAGDVMEELVVNATVNDDFGIGDVSLVIGETEISPKEKTGTTGDTQWTLTWEIPYTTYGSYQGFTITMTDTNGNVDTQVFNYTISDCIYGQVRPCDPRDPTTNIPYDKGVCRHSGNITCGPDGMWGNCTGGTFPSDEVCNGLDDNCNGEVDDGLESQPCGPLDAVIWDKSICKLGTKSCVSGTWSTCKGARYPENQEICGNGWDDNCDGYEDEDCECSTEGETQPCGVSNVGICQLGTKICEGGKWSACQNAVIPETEICSDNLDNDCDGYTDCDDSDCYGGSVCEGPGPRPPTDGEPFPWWLLIVIGVAMLVVLAVLLAYFRRQGEELTWETVKKKWSY